MLPVRLAGLMRGESGMFALLSSELTDVPLYLAACEASIGPARGHPGASQVTLRGHELGNQSRERNKAEIRLAASEARRRVYLQGVNETE